MKKFTVALTLIALFISTTFICGAKSAENLIKDEEKNSKAELKQIQELIDYDSEFLTSMMPSLNASVDKNQKEHENGQCLQAVQTEFGIHLRRLYKKRKFRLND